MDLLAITNVYATQDDDCIQLPLGDVFCRMLMGDDSLCVNVGVVRSMDCTIDHLLILYRNLHFLHPQT